MMFQSAPTPTPSPWDNDPIVAAPTHARAPARIPGPAPFREPTPQTPTQAAMDVEQLRGERLRNQKTEADLAATQHVDPPGNAALIGDEYLATLPPALQAQVKALSEGRLPIPTGAALRSPQVMQLWAAASQYDPALDASTYPSRRKAFTDRTSGMMARNITSLNTALGHLESLDASIDKLGNWSGVPLANYALNLVRNAAIRGSGSGGNLRSFETARQAATEELTRAFRQSGGSVHDIEGWEKTLDEANSPEELHAAVKQMVDLLGSRMQAIGDQYGQAMGSPTDPMTLLNPHAQQVMQRLGTGWTAPPPGSPGERAVFDAASGAEGEPVVAGDPTKETEIPFSTDADKRFAAETTAIFNSSKPGEERAALDAYAAQHGVPPFGEDLDRAIEARAHGGVVTFNPAQTGRKKMSALEGRRSQDAASPFGSTVVGAFNGITGGYSDEITGGINAVLKGTSVSREIADANFKKNLITASHPYAALGGKRAQRCATGNASGCLGCAGTPCRRCRIRGALRFRRE
jgi:hypothetical protein